MYCTFNGKICLMMWDIVSEKWCYISEEVWYRLTEKQDHVIPRSAHIIKSL